MTTLPSFRPSWTVDSGLSTDDGAVFWMSPDDAPHAPESVIAQITVASRVVGLDEDGAVIRVISDCQFSVQLNHFISFFLSYSVAIF
jgi:hypothetical protein